MYTYNEQMLKSKQEDFLCPQVKKMTTVVMMMRMMM
jgi:hypothetical protein